MIHDTQTIISDDIKDFLILNPSFYDKFDNFTKEEKVLTVKILNTLI